MDKKHFGSRNELIACAWLLEQGYEVFRNVSAHGLVDIIAMKDGKTYHFDVKGGQTKLSETQVAMGVKRLTVANGMCAIDDGGRGGARLCTICDRPLTQSGFTRQCVRCLTWKLGMAANGDLNP